MDIKFLSSTDVLLKAFEEQVKDCDSFWIASAWASSGQEKSPHWKIIEAHKDKLKEAVIGLHFHQTEPRILFKLHEWYKLNLVYDTNGVYHPKFYLFEKGDSFSIILGSSNFTVGGFFRNFENNILMQGKKEESVYFEAKGFYELCKKRSRIPDKKDLEKYESEYETLIGASVNISTFVAEESRQEMFTKPGDRLPDFSWEGLFKFHFEEYVHGLKYLDVTKYANYNLSIFFSKENDVRSDTINAIDSYQKIIHKYQSLEAMPLDERKAFCGTSGFSSVYGNCGWLGSMKGAGYFKQMVINNPEIFDQYLNQIPLVGNVSEDNVRDYLSGILSLDNIGVAIALRLLTAKRPDLFLTINQASAKALANFTNIKDLKYNSNKKQEFIEAYIELHKRIYSTPWFLENKPTEGIESKIFQYRVALLDCFFYEFEEQQ